MQVRLAGNDCAVGAQPLDEPRIFGGVAVEVTIETYAAARGRAGQVKAVFYGDR